MADTVTGPCTLWATAEDVAACPTQGLEDGAVLAKIPAASDLLYRMSGHQFPGTCTVTIRPEAVCCGGPVAVPAAEGYWIPDGVAGTLAVNRLCGCSADGRRLWLPDEDVTAVTDVTIGGQELDDESYRLEDGRILVRLDGAPWPSVQEPAATGEPGTWTVTYTHGLAPPDGGVVAAVALAVELAKACAADGDTCALPARARSASRGGLEYELHPGDLLTEGQTGIWVVDLFIQATNPHGLTKGSSVRSPDRPRGGVVT